jgi:hypothetical protein
MLVAYICSVYWQNIVMNNLKLAFFKILSVLMKILLPKVYKQPDLTRLSKFYLLVLGIKRWITFHYLDALNKDFSGIIENR